jgi:hypothetical protein
MTPNFTRVNLKCEQWASVEKIFITACRSLQFQLAMAICFARTCVSTGHVYSDETPGECPVSTPFKFFFKGRCRQLQSESLAVIGLHEKTASKKRAPDSWKTSAGESIKNDRPTKNHSARTFRKSNGPIQACTIRGRIE